MKRIRFNWISIVGMMTAATLGWSTSAQSIPLKDLDEGEFKSLVGELSTNFLHTSVEGAATLGEIFGFEVGLVGGITKTPKINSTAQAVDSSASVPQVFHASVLGVVSVPLGFTIEAGILPKVGSEDFKVNAFSIAGKWTPGMLLGELPVDLAAKISITKGHAEFHTSSGGADTDYEYDSKSTALQLLVSKNFAIVEPYFGIGRVSSEGKLIASGAYATDLFTYTGEASATASTTGTMWMLGANLNLVVVKLGAEYTRLYDTNRFSGKLSFYF